ncbi:MAG: ABC transporter family substrate-binding protein [Micrococcales bacterium]
MKFKRILGVAASVATAALVVTSLTGCAGGAKDVVEGSAISVAWNQGFYSANSATSNGNATANNNILYLANSGFNYYNEKMELVKNEQFGKYEVLSNDPLTIKYTVNSGVKWSDGADVDAADMLLAWAANSCIFNNVAPEYDAEGNVSNQAALDAGVFFDSASCGGDLGKVTKTPEISDGGRAITLVYDEPIVDWELNFGIGVSAHVTVQQAFAGDKLDAKAAKDKLIKAIQDKDAATLSPIAKAWSTAYDFEDLPSDASLLVSNGAYVITGLVKDQYVTLTANKNYSWGPSPKIETITVKTIPDPLAAVQALENGEVDVISPQATADILTALNAIANKGIVTDATSDATYEHIDLTFNNGGPFDPATYGGDAEKAKKVRQAFLKTIPRSDIVTKLIQPINPDAQVNNAQTILPGAPGYDEMAAANGSADYANVDIEGAKALLAEAGVTTPVAVKFLFGCANTRRNNEYALIQASAAQAGFDVQNKCSATWGADLGSGVYDAVVFGWQSTSTAVTSSKSTFASDGGNNLNGYKNDAVDAAYAKLSTEFDKAKQLELLIEVEKNLWADAYGVTVFQFPGVTAYNSNKVSGIVPAPLAPMFFWNFWEWKQEGEIVKG